MFPYTSEKCEKCDQAPFPNFWGGTWGQGQVLGKGRTKITTSGAHDVIPITSAQKNDLRTEELRDRAQLAKSLDSLMGQSGCCLYLGRERRLWS